MGDLLGLRFIKICLQIFLLRLCKKNVPNDLMNVYLTDLEQRKYTPKEIFSFC